MSFVGYQRIFGEFSGSNEIKFEDYFFWLIFYPEVKVYYWSKFQVWETSQSRDLEGGGVYALPIPTVEVFEVALRRVRNVAQNWLI